MSDLISRQWLMECVNEGWIKFDTEKDENRFIHLVRDIAPSAEEEPCEDAVSRKAVIDAIDEWKEACADSGHKETVSDIMLIRKDFIGLPPVTPKQRTDTLKAEIRRMKRSFTICINSDYYTGYMSALSAVEGYIARWEGDTE